ncbi:S-adenosylmethionine:tRNA ribosyltransferase-isomerase [Thermaurantimonas aggregans]|uniref:S-adenosylmethionine:tRNA ribosyltransferase-isomerase n=1 Tax=Thermaurantimonas aggregans TaxID=2173829 RepID=A0A401XNR1_9FLAO|nr:S-adenosylmethionine:tRNA ribosyltransferase-isomerase [Thermaurantimonas aggregans]MCX8149482.1 S-adenosylmethionine:tRNA ribosyltransferase-isomerase [Thermaurantimonas aggregans]GCD78656.1 S-adenosylmethionine:tRNA ribosyltransferase-isomerase [Thermaurantimonas aggregans]
MSLIPEIRISDFDYELPAERIAAYPLEERDQSKLLVYKDGMITDAVFNQLSEFLPDGASMYFNQSKVVFTRLFFKIHDSDEKHVEIFCLEPADGLELASALTSKNSVVMKCMVGRAKRWKDQELTMRIPHSRGDIMLYAEKAGRQNDVFLVHFTWSADITFAEILELAGHVPLPPYIKREDEAIDRSRYQTIYARREGSVAAPTAGLHFTERVFESLRKKDVALNFLTLHVGAGTFAPVKSEYIAQHQMHGEYIEITRELLESLLQRKQRIAVGTTSLRTLESIYYLGVRTMLEGDLSIHDLDQWCGFTYPKDIAFEQSIEQLLKVFDLHKIDSGIKLKTHLIIAPGYQIRSVDALVTNFHQPSSTLLLLVSAVTGGEWCKIYDHALAHGYRFLSYGDSSLLFVKK